MKLSRTSGCFLVVCIAGAVCSAGEFLSRAEKPEQPTDRPLMQAKLASSQNILDGIVTNDFTKLSNGAEELRRACLSIAWERDKDQVYAHYRTEMLRLCQKLSTVSEKRNLEGATFTYMHMLNVCISCHDHCRDVLKVADEDEVQLQAVPSPLQEGKLYLEDASVVR